MKIIESKQKKALFQTFSVVLLISVIIGLVAFHYIRGSYWLTSDDSSELILSKLLASQNKLITTDWYYSSELRVLNTQIFYTLLFKLTNNWKLVRIVSCICMYLVMLVAYYVLCRAIGNRKIFAISAVLFFVPFSEQWFSFVLRGIYYIPHITITLLAIAIVEMYIKGIGYKSEIWFVLSSLLAFLSGLGGARQIFVCYLPLILSSSLVSVTGIIKVMSNEETCSIIKRSYEGNKKYFLIAMVTFVSSLLGYLVNTFFLSKVYHFQTWESISFTEFDMTKLSQILNGFMNIFGYSTGKLFSIATFSNIVCFFWIILMITAIIYGIKNRTKVTESYYRLSIFMATAMTVFFMLYLFTDMSYADRYNIPVIAVSIPLIADFFCQFKWKANKNHFCFVLFVIMVLIDSLFMYQNIWLVDRTSEMQQIAAVLCENGYNNGYATFWQANLLTELSNGEIEVWDWLDGKDGTPMKNLLDVDQIYEWLQVTSHKDSHPEGKVFLLFTNSELENWIWKENLSPEEIGYQSDSYTAYIYESYEEMIHKVYQRYRFCFADNKYLENGLDTNGTRRIYQGGISYGPYQFLPAGDYTVTIEGEGLLRAEMDCVCEKGQIIVPIEMTEKTDCKVQYVFKLTDKVTDIETRIKNYSEDPIDLSLLVIEKDG